MLKVQTRLAPTLMALAIGGHSRYQLAGAPLGTRANLPDLGDGIDPLRILTTRRRWGHVV
jgi:hypothetical protein